MTWPVLKESVFDYQFLFEAIEDGVLLAAEDGTILDINPAACRILRRRQEDVRTAALDEFFDPSDPRLELALEERRRTGRFGGELRMLGRDGTPFPAEVSMVGYWGKTGQGRIGIVFRDVTEGKRVEEEIRQHNEELGYRVEEWAVRHEATAGELENRDEMLRELEERYSILTEQMSDGIWDWDVRTGTMHWNNRLFEILDLSPSGFTPTFEGFLELLHPEDRQGIMHLAVTRLAQNTQEHDLTFAKQLRLLHSTGEYHYCIIRGKTLRDQNGVLLRVVGIVVDVTERKRREQELRESEERFQATFDLAPVGIAHVGTDGRFLKVNKKLYEITGYTREELLEKTFQDIMYPDDLDDQFEQVRRLLVSGAESYSIEKHYVKKDQTQVWVNLTASLVREPSGKPKYLIFAIEDITQRRQAESISKDLTPREVEVLQHLAQGSTNKEIAESMMFSEGTAKINVQHIMTKLGARNRTQAVLRAAEIGLISPSSRSPYPPYHKTDSPRHAPPSGQSFVRQ